MGKDNGKDKDNVFNFEAFRKAMEELNKKQAAQEEEQAQQQSDAQDYYANMFNAFSTIFKPPSQEEVNKAAAQFADSLENAAKVIRAMQQPAANDDDGDNGDEGGEA